MPNLRIFFAISILTLAACAPNRHPSPARIEWQEAARAGVLGEWKAENASYFSRDREMLSVSHDRVTIHKICRSWGWSTPLTIAAPARVSGSHIEILAAQRAVSAPGQVPCEVKLDAGVIAFEIRNDALVFTPALGQTYVYGHRPRPVASGAWSASPRATSPGNARARAQAARSIGWAWDNWSSDSGARSTSGSTYRATSRPSTRTVTNSRGTGVVRNSGRGRSARGR